MLAAAAVARTLPPPPALALLLLLLLVRLLLPPALPPLPHVPLFQRRVLMGGAASAAAAAMSQPPAPLLLPAAVLGLPMRDDVGAACCPAPGPAGILLGVCRKRGLSRLRVVWLKLLNVLPLLLRALSWPPPAAAAPRGPGCTRGEGAGGGRLALELLQPLAGWLAPAALRGDGGPPACLLKMGDALSAALPPPLGDAAAAAGVAPAALLPSSRAAERGVSIALRLPPRACLLFSCAGPSSLPPPPLLLRRRSRAARALRGVVLPLLLAAPCVGGGPRALLTPTRAGVARLLPGPWAACADAAVVLSRGSSGGLPAMQTLGDSWRANRSPVLCVLTLLLVLVARGSMPA
jgi:hypothetical protein